jgi:small redox-active disulfide protein 2
MVIKILGSGCAKCKQLETNAKDALTSSGIDALVEKITDMKLIMAYGVMRTPAIVIDEKVAASGKLLSVEEITKLIKG